VQQSVVECTGTTYSIIYQVFKRELTSFCFTKQQ